MSLLNMFNLSSSVLDIWDTVITTIFISLSSNSSICVSSGLVLINSLFFSLWIIFFCFLACLVIFYCMMHIEFYFCVGIFIFLYIFLSSVLELCFRSYLDAIWFFLLSGFKYLFGGSRAARSLGLIIFHS